MIIGFDPGLINTGWGVLQKNDKRKLILTRLYIYSKNDQLGMRLKKIYEESLYLLRRYTRVYSVEKIFANKNPESTMKLGKARAMVFLVVKENIDIFEYSPNTVKKNLVGYGQQQSYKYQK